MAAIAAAGIGLWGCGDKDPAAAGSAPEARRVITLTPSATEIVAALGATDRLVGVDRYSTYPPEVTELPEVGDFLHPSFDSILHLEPDLVIADNVQAKVVSGLEAAGIRVVILPMQDLEDVRAAIATVGRELGKSAAAHEVLAGLDGAIEAAKARARARQSHPRVLAVVDRQHGGLAGLVACGPQSYLDELLGIVGAQNALSITGRYARISPEAVLAARPEVIVDASHGANPDGARAAYGVLAEVPAVQGRRIHLLKEPYYIAPGPRATAAIAGLERLLYGVSD